MLFSTIITAIVLIMKNSGSTMAVFIPGDQQCPSANQWKSRSCWRQGGGDSGWREYCHDPSNRGGELSWKEESCSAGEMCHDILAQDSDDPQPKRIVACIPRPRRDHEFVPDGQAGVIVVHNQGSAAAQQTVSIHVLQGLPKATVSAVIQGMYLSSLSESAHLSLLCRNTWTPHCAESYSRLSARR